jgi:hypothetical protein
LIIPGKLDVKRTFSEDLLVAPLSRLSITWKNKLGAFEKYRHIRFTVGIRQVLSRYLGIC